MRSTHRPRPCAPVVFLIAASATVGFAFFLMELVWYRLLAPLLGGSVFTFGLVLAVALVGIGLGGLHVQRCSPQTGRRRSPRSRRRCLLEAAAVAVTFALGDRVALLSARAAAARRGRDSPRDRRLDAGVRDRRAAAGDRRRLSVPAAHRAVRPGPRTRRAHIGLAYARQHRGRDRRVAGRRVRRCCRGSRRPGAWRLVAVLLLARSACWAAALTTRCASGARLLSVHGAASPWLSCVVFLIAAAGPSGHLASRRHRRGPRRRRMSFIAEPAARMEPGRHRNVLWERDGVESSVALVTDTDGYAFIVNGKADGNARVDAGTQVMLGLLGDDPAIRSRARARHRPGHGQHAPDGSAPCRRWSASTSSSSSRWCSTSRARAGRSTTDVLAEPEGARHDRRRPRNAAHDAASATT